MNNDTKKAFNALKKLGLPVKENATAANDGLFWIDSEETGGEEHLSYWGEDSRFGSVKLWEVLDKHNMFFEWYNPAFANIYKD